MQGYQAFDTNFSDQLSFITFLFDPAGAHFAYKEIQWELTQGLNKA